MPAPRRFPPPWSIEERQACFIVKDGNGQALAYVYFEEEPGRRAAVNLMSHDEAGALALNIAKLPELLRQPRMTRWGEVIDNLLADLETETPGAEGFRVNIDHKIWEAEKIARGAPPIRLDETPEGRLHGFQTELVVKLSERLNRDPSNKIWHEARALLENQRLRVPEHRRPDLK
jgi:hypothetical protein